MSSLSMTVHEIGLWKNKRMKRISEIFPLAIEYGMTLFTKHEVTLTLKEPEYFGDLKAEGGLNQPTTVFVLLCG